MGKRVVLPHHARVKVSGLFLPAKYAREYIRTPDDEKHLLDEASRAPMRWEHQRRRNVGQWQRAYRKDTPEGPEYHVEGYLYSVSQVPESEVEEQERLLEVVGAGHISGVSLRLEDITDKDENRFTNLFEISVCKKGQFEGTGLKVVPVAATAGAKEKGSVTFYGPARVEISESKKTVPPPPVHFFGDSSSPSPTQPVAPKTMDTPTEDTQMHDHTGPVNGAYQQQGSQAPDAQAAPAQAQPTQQATEAAAAKKTKHADEAVFRYDIDGKLINQRELNTTGLPPEQQETLTAEQSEHFIRMKRQFAEELEAKEAEIKRLRSSAGGLEEAFAASREHIVKHVQKGTKEFGQSSDLLTAGINEVAGRTDRQSMAVMDYMKFLTNAASQAKQQAEAVYKEKMELQQKLHAAREARLGDAAVIAAFQQSEGNRLGIRLPAIGPDADKAKAAPAKQAAPTQTPHQQYQQFQQQLATASYNQDFPAHTVRQINTDSFGHRTVDVAASADVNSSTAPVPRQPMNAAMAFAEKMNPSGQYGLNYTQGLYELATSR